MGTDFRIRIMQFLIKIFVFTVFDNTDKLKKLKLGPKFSHPKALIAVIFEPY